MSNTSSSEAVAAEVRAHLGRLRVSQTRAAKHLRIGQASMSRRLAGSYPFTVDEIYRLAELFGVEACDLMPNASMTPAEASA